MTIVDLAAEIEIPSVFDPIKGPARGELLFLQDLIAELGKPLENEGRNQLDYIPTQVFCEYLLRVFDGGARGIRWRSAVGAGISVALDIASNECVEDNERLPDALQLVRIPETTHTYKRVDEFIATS